MGFSVIEFLRVTYYSVIYRRRAFAPGRYRGFMGFKWHCAFHRLSRFQFRLWECLLRTSFFMMIVLFQALLAISRVGRGGRSRRKRVVANAGSAPEHSPLDLSAGGESAAKRARLSTSPSTRSDSDERDGASNDGEYE